MRGPLPNDSLVCPSMNTYSYASLGLLGWVLSPCYEPDTVAGIDKMYRFTFGLTKERQDRAGIASRLKERKSDELTNLAKLDDILPV